MNANKIKARTKRTPPATPTPMPILAPVERPELATAIGVLELAAPVAVLEEAWDVVEVEEINVELDDVEVSDGLGLTVVRRLVTVLVPLLEVVSLLVGGILVEVASVDVGVVSVDVTVV